MEEKTSISEDTSTTALATLKMLVQLLEKDEIVIKGIGAQLNQSRTSHLYINWDRKEEPSK